MASGSCNRLIHKTQGVTNVVHCACACSRHLFAASLTQLPCICHGSVDDPKENAKGPFSAFVFDASITFRCLPSHLFTVNFGFIPRYVDVAVTRLLSY
ncbi:hypothetical protein T12_1994 [Trichinella patagoniensis]|uniref:Uncharacterized protein n=1 Tax=Trichinella patagoniensis TaxID=990121 RepID=A0A0V0Z585_9BILA|nr:hypothetical protein T12_1994 [Trichinella patagoniensis]